MTVLVWNNIDELDIPSTFTYKKLWSMLKKASAINIT